ncbi:ABC-type multidrug transport system ATPase component [Patulibacter medicamentivorans]|uniref:ABC-type multidrug transport system ATPase component n=1 Tax=Patulibacter medicamentivorans TaxID=1097667 RepID=H0E8U1_9ACTN|nr:ABC-type multidrug transport system ATPase component [Patulibacter medicamentivorans]
MVGLRRRPHALSLRSAVASSDVAGPPLPAAAARPVGASAPKVAASAEPAVLIDGLVKRYGERTAVDGVQLRVERARVLALLGPNGAGKTTTIETCVGFRRPDAGRVRVLGLDPIADSEALRPRIGVMLQSGGVYQAARCGEMLRLVAAYAADPLDPEQLLDRLGLREVVRTPYRRLSGGQQQRLSLAMAIVGRPELVFLDEPTAGLDPQARHETWRIVESLRADGVTVVLTTHYMDEAERLADDIVIVDHGKVIATGTPAELIRGGADREIRFRAAPGLPLATLEPRLPADCVVAEPAAGTYVVAGPVDPQLVATVTAWCAERGVLVEGLQVKQRTLEDVFLELTGRELRA